MPFLYLTKSVRAIKKIKNLQELRRFLRKLLYSYQEEIILLKDLNDLTPFSLKDRLQMQSIEKKHLPSLGLIRKQADIGEKYPLKILNEYLDNNCKGFIAELKGEIIGYIWWGNDTMKSDVSDIAFKFYAKEIKLNATDAYGFDFFIDRQYRGNGHAIEFMTNFFSLLHSLGYERTFGYVASDNLPARWIYELVGYKGIRKVKVRRFLQFIVFRDKRLFFDKNAVG